MTASLKAQQPTESFGTLAAQAAQARDANRLGDATRLYQRALALHPDWKEGWWSLGTLHYDQSQYRDAARAFDRLVALDPKNGTAHAMLGLSEFETGDDKAALKHIEEAKSLKLANDPQLVQVLLYHEAVLLRRAGKVEAAVGALGELCIHDPANSDILRQLGMATMRMRDRNPPQPGSDAANAAQKMGEATCLVARKQFDQGRSVADTTVKSYPDVANIHYSYGRLLLQEHDTAAATAQFQQQIAHNPEDVFSRLEIAAVNYRVNSKAGIPYAQKAVELDPRLPFGHFLLGLLLADVSDYEHAIPQLEIARRFFPNEPKVYFALGTAYARMGRARDAAEARATFARLSQQQAQNSSPSNLPSDPVLSNGNTVAEPAPQ